MSARLRVPCQSCGPVKVPADQVTIRHAWGGDRIEWECPNGCGPAVWRPHPAYRGYLDAHGVDVREVWEVPRELADPLRGRPRTPWAEDVIDAGAVAWWERIKDADIIAEVEATNNQEGK